MKTTPEFCLVTSIVPGQRIDIQCEAVQSWQEYDFQIVSLNTQSEIDKFAGIFPNVRFLPQPRDGRIIAGKPVIYVNDILDYLRETKYKFCGIINSDIYLAPVYQIRERIETAINDTLLICPRTDVANFTAVNGTLDPYGFDAFFFEREMLTLWD